MNNLFASKKSVAAAVLVGLALIKISNTEAAPMTIQKGSTVSIHYTLTVDNQVVDSSVGKEPLKYVQGSGQIIPGLEEQLSGMKKGGKKQVTVQPQKGYGMVDPNAIQEVPRKRFGKMKDLKVGQAVMGQFNGYPVRATVVRVDKDMVTLDLNHPLAGKTLNFDVEVMEVR